MSKKKDVLTFGKAKPIVYINCPRCETSVKDTGHYTRCPYCSNHIDRSEEYGKKKDAELESQRKSG